MGFGTKKGQNTSQKQRGGNSGWVFFFVCSNRLCSRCKATLFGLVGIRMIPGILYQYVPGIDVVHICSELVLCICYRRLCPKEGGWKGLSTGVVFRGGEEGVLAVEVLL